MDGNIFAEEQGFMNAYMQSIANVEPCVSATSASPSELESLSELELAVAARDDLIVSSILSKSISQKKKTKFQYTNKKRDSVLKVPKNIILLLI
jgi:hypothetical protein